MNSGVIQNRLKTLRKRMKQETIKALIVTDKYDVYYLTLFESAVDAKLIITQKNALFITDLRYKDEKISTEYSLCVVKEKNDWQQVQKRLDGIDSISYVPATITVAALKMWRKNIKKSFLQAKKNILQDLRMKKDLFEIQAIQEAQGITELALTKLAKQISVGMTEKEISQKLKIALLESGSEEFSFDPIVASGPNSALPHAKPTDRKVHAHEVLLIDCGAVYQRYHGDMTRIFVIGGLRTEFKTIFSAVEDAYEAAFQAVKPGATCSDVDGAARQSLTTKQYDSYFSHSTGHGVGLYIHEAPVIAPNQTVTIEPGMVFSIEPGVYMPGKGGIRLENLVAIDESGKPIMLNKLPFLISI